MAKAPLQALRVLEIGGGVAVRYCGRLFARLGAAVTRIDGGVPDDRLSYGGACGTAYGAWLDDGKARADDPGAGPYDLVIAGQARADVAAAAEMAARLAGGPAVLGLTWFDHRGPYADWAANDPIIHALTGASFSFGLPEGPPVLAQGHSPQTVAGLTGFIAALAALMNPRAGPARIDVNVFEAAMCFTETAGAVGPTAITSHRLGVNRFMPTYPASVYEAADGFVGITALTPAQWASLCRIIDRTDLAADPRFATSVDRLINSQVIDEVLVPAVRERSMAHWLEQGDRLRVPIAPVPTPGEMPDVPHWAGRGAFAHVGGDRTAPRGPTLPFRIAWDGETSPRPVGGSKGPLEGVRVADFSMGWAGPLAGRYLGDLGADVVKIESRAKPDWWRGWEVVPDADPPPSELAPNFMCVNRSKRGLDLDLTAPADLARAKSLIAASEVVLENLGPGVMDRLGLGPAEQRQLRPGVISVAMPPFGKGGPLSGIRAYGSTVEHACGMPFANGFDHWPPCLQHVAYGDPVAGLYAAAAVLAALHGRERLGGADIELCQVECLFQLGADAGIAQQVMDAPPPRTGSRRATASVSCVVAGAGQEAWLAVVADSEEAWKALCGALARPQWQALPLSDRHAIAEDIEEAIAAWSADKAPQEAAIGLQAAGVPAAPVYPMSSRWSDPHLAAAGYWLAQMRRYIGPHLTPQPPYRFDGERPVVRRAAPVLGEHTAEVLSELGIQ